MAEAFGVAAGVAGFIGLAGQAAEGWIFLRDFFNDMMNVPDHLRSLHDTVGTIDFLVRSIGDGLRTSQQLGVNLEDVDFEAALSRCFHAIDEVGKMIRDDVARIDQGSWRWKMKVAAGKKRVAEALAKLFWARDNLHILEAHVQSRLHHRHTLALNRICGQLGVSVAEFNPSISDQGDVINGSETLELESFSHSITPIEDVLSTVPRSSLALASSNETNDEEQVANRNEEQVSNQNKEQGTTQDESESDAGPKHQISKVSDAKPLYTRWRLWPFRKGIHISFMSPSRPGLLEIGLQLRVYNFVSPESSIIQACKNLDIDGVRSLFKYGLASPYDVSTEGSIFDIVFTSLLWSPVESKTKSASELLECIVEAAGWRVMQNGKWLREAALRHVDTDICSSVHAPYISKSLRLLISSAVDDPFEESGHHLPRFLSCRDRTNSLFGPLISQDRWHVDWEHTNCKACDSLFENDYSIMRDPRGLNLRNALSEGKKYYPSFNHPYSSVFQQAQPFHNLLLMASCHRRNETLIEGCRNRWQFFLEYGLNPGYVVMMGQDMDLNIMGYVSAYECADRLGLWKGLFQSDLIAAGWTTTEIEDLQDESLYAGVPELVDGTITYKSRYECRLEFVETLVTGSIPGDFHDRVVEVGCAIGSYHYRYVYATLSSCYDAMKRKEVPGMWPVEEASRLVPGKDFQWCLFWSPETCLNYKSGLVREDDEIYTRRTSYF